MDLKNQIESLVKEAKIYQTQGLLSEAGEKYKRVRELIESARNIKNREKLLKNISEKIAEVSQQQEILANSESKPQLTEEVQDLIKDVFTSPDDENKIAAAMEGAVTLAKFGQYDRAVREFTQLLEIDDARVEAAKNIIRCHLESDDNEEAVSVYGNWMGEDRFSDDEKENVRNFIEKIFAKKGLTEKLHDALPSLPVYEEEIPIIPEDEFLDISSVAITFENGPASGEQIELDVSFQSGNLISLIISAREKEIVDNLKVGVKINDMQFFSPIAIFKSSGVVSAKTRIDSGPKQGDYCLDIRVKTT